MRQVEQVVQHHQRVGAALVEAVHAVERTRRIAPQHGLEQIEHEVAVGDAEHVAHRRFLDRAGRVARQRDRLVEQ